MNETDPHQQDERDRWAGKGGCSAPPACSTLMEDYLGAVKERDKILDVLLAIVNTAQDNPDRCMADVCNDNFTAHNLPLSAVMTGSEHNRIKIINTSNEKLCDNAERHSQKRIVGL